MAVTNTTPVPSASRGGTRLRIIGIIIMVIGFSGAGFLYWSSAPSADDSDEVPTAQTSKKVARDIEVNFGKMGLLTATLADDLQDPATQAIIILAASILVTSGCFYVAHLQDRLNQSDGPAP